NELAEQVLTQVDGLLGRHHIVPNAVQTQMLTSHVRAMAHRSIQGMGATLRQDEKGNTIVSLPSGDYALNKPGLSPQDLTSFLA
ncbi:hypothetical protein MJN54_35475, partial [Salmonella enterica subsp. enterica serovar Kentucky]|nr:hypothetical protein [Salmonella enterica subsp. enterica serovar Kentucky]